MSIKLGDDHVRVPKLDVGGTNWVLYKERLTWAADAKGLAGHLDGTSIQPVAPPMAGGNVTAQGGGTAAGAAVATAGAGGEADAAAAGGTGGGGAEAAVLVDGNPGPGVVPDPTQEAYLAKLATWKKSEAVIKQLIASTIPDSLFMKVRAKGTAREIWAALAAEFERRSRMISLDLRRRLQEQRCGEKADVRAHFAKLRTMYEDLAAMGHTPEDDDFYAIILGSMPTSFETYISSLTASSTITGTVLMPEQLMTALTDEYDRRALHSKPGRSGGESGDVALSAYDKSGKGKKKNVECFNCKKRGHYKSDCWAPGGGKEGQGPKDKEKSKDKASKASEKDKDKAWYVHVASDSDTDSVPDLETVSDSSFDSDTDDVDNEFNEDFTTHHGAMLAGNPPTEDEEAILDSGATSHMSPHLQRFISYRPIPPKNINAADNHIFRGVGRGDMWITVPRDEDGTETTRVLLRNVLHAPAMDITLVSIARIVAAGSTVAFLPKGCQVSNSEGDVIASIPLVRGLYRTTMRRDEEAMPMREGESEEAEPTVTRAITLDEAHRMLGHVSYDTARNAITRGLVKGVSLIPGSKPTVCDACEAGKTTRKPITKERVRPRATAVGDEVHSDVWGPARTETLGRRLYNSLFIDDYSRHTTVYLQRAKVETFESYKKVEAFYRTQKGAQIKCLHTDRGGEYLSQEFSAHLAAHGTIRKLTTHDTPEYNGVGERANRTHFEKVRAMLHDSGLPKSLWGEALNYAVYTKNRTPTRALNGKTPHEAFWGTKPDISHLHPWGFEVRIHSPGGSKLSDRARIACWVGWDEASDAHRIYWPDRRIVTVERSVRFNVVDVNVMVPLEGERDDENNGAGTHLGERAPMPSLQPVPDMSNDEPPPLELEPPADNPPTSQPSSDPKPVAAKDDLVSERPKRVRKESDYVKRLRSGEGSVGGRKSGRVLPKGMQAGTESARKTTVEEVEDEEGFVMVAQEDREEWEMVELAMSAATGEAECLDPTYAEAKKRPDWPKWQAAIQAELDALKANGTWELIARPTNTDVVDSKWVLHVKKDSAGEIEKYKARLVARGFTQIHGVNYTDTFAPVARLSSIRSIFAIANRNGWPIDVFDFSNAFLNSTLDEDVYLEQPPHHEFADRRKYVLKLKKALYGLKQGGRKWYETLCAALTDLGFGRVEADHGVFFKREDDHLVVLAVHVDDCIITGDSGTLNNSYKTHFSKRYKLTDLGPVSWVLGIKVTRDLEAHTLSLSQHAYIDSILTRYNFDDLKPISTPMDPHLQLSKTQCPQSAFDVARMKRVPYHEAIGALMYAAMGTRPDIAFAVSTLAQYSENPGWTHWEVVKRVFRYLLGTRHLSLVYGGGRDGLEGFVDADGSSQEHRRAITGYVFLIDGGAVSWASKKQELVTLSTAESEYVAATHAAKEAIWLRRLIGEVFDPLSEPTTLHGDNQAAIALTKDGSYHARTKHIDIRYHFIRYSIEAGSIRLIYCPTDNQTADILTKALPSVKVKHFASALGLAPA